MEFWILQKSGFLVVTFAPKMLESQSKAQKQPCPTRDPVKGFVQPNLGFRCSKSSLHDDNLSLF